MPGVGYHPDLLAKEAPEYLQMIKAIVIRTPSPIAKTFHAWVAGHERNQAGTELEAPFQLASFHSAGRCIMQASGQELSSILSDC